MQGQAVRRAAATILTALALSHCAMPQPPAPTGAGAPAVAPETAPPTAPPLLAAYPLIDLPALQARVDAVGRRVARIGNPSMGWIFGVIDHPGHAAYPFADGRIYLARGLVARLNSEAELAAVLAREIAHVVAHSTPVARAVPTLPGLIGPTPDFDLDETPVYAPSDHADADARAAHYLAEAGYEPRALLAVAGRDDEIRKRVVELARQGAGPDYRIGREEFLTTLAGLPWGWPPEFGRLVGTTLLHDAVGLAFTFPAGWKVVREAGRALARSPEGDGLIELVWLTGDDVPAAALQKLLRLDPGARYDAGAINGLPAAFAAGAAGGRPVLASVLRHGKRLVAVAVQSRDNASYLRDRAVLRAALNSVRPLTAQEHGPRRQLKLKVVTLEPGMSLTRLAATSPLGEAAANALRQLNRLPPKAELRAGQQLKLVE